MNVGLILKGIRTEGQRVTKRNIRIPSGTLGTFMSIVTAVVTITTQVTDCCQSPAASINNMNKPQCTITGKSTVFQ